MPAFRKDPFGEGWVLISPVRGLEASEFGSVSSSSGDAGVAGGSGSGGQELLTPGSGRDGAGGSAWGVTVVRHPSPLLHERKAHFSGQPPFEQAGDSGYQEVVVEHPDPSVRLENMSREHLTDVLRVYRDRLAVLSRRQDVRHVQLSRSVGRVAGALFDAPHAQLLALPVNNRWLEEERRTAAAHHERTGRCLFCDVLDSELRERERVISQNEHFLTIAPYAAKRPFESWIVPRGHNGPFTEEPIERLPALAAALQTLVRALNSALADPPYNMILHTLITPCSYFHWHLEILPQLTRQAGFRWETGYYLNPTPPEDAARFLREAMALEEVAG